MVKFIISKLNDKFWSNFRNLISLIINNINRYKFEKFKEKYVFKTGTKMFLDIICTSNMYIKRNDRLIIALSFFENRFEDLT